MKRVFIISLVVIGLGFVSCQKEVFTPNSEEEMEVPVWQDNARGSDSTDDGTSNDDIGGITDPNTEDENEDENDDATSQNEGGDGDNEKSGKKRKGYQ